MQHVDGGSESDRVNRPKRIAVVARDHLQDVATQAPERLDSSVSQSDLGLIERIADHVLYGLRKALEIRLGGTDPFDRFERATGHISL